MTPDEATRVLRKHAHTDESREGLLGWLCPYRGVNGDHLVEIVEAIHTLVPVICSGRTVERQLVGIIWNLCFTARQWTRGPREPMFHGRAFITPEDKARLDDWLFQVERWMILLLNSGDQGFTFDWHVFKRLGIADRAGFALPVLMRQLREDLTADPDFTEDHKIPYCEILAAMGPLASPAAELLSEVVRVTRSDEVREAAQAALAVIRPRSR